uniref:Uncharacterized protein n=1 Tax=Bubo bubo TaxID=30461 RepID=A0A8C0IA43_BUBBB
MAEPSGNELASAAAKGDLVQLTNFGQNHYFNRGSPSMSNGLRVC